MRPHRLRLPPSPASGSASGAACDSASAACAGGGAAAGVAACGAGGATGRCAAACAVGAAAWMGGAWRGREKKELGSSDQL